MFSKRRIINQKIEEAKRIENERRQEEERKRKLLERKIEVEAKEIVKPKRMVPKDYIEHMVRVKRERSELKRVNVNVDSKTNFATKQRERYSEMIKEKKENNERKCCEEKTSASNTEINDKQERQRIKNEINAKRRGLA